MLAARFMDVPTPTLDTAKASAALRSYWRTNLVIMSVLLLLWAFFGLGCGVLWADWLNQFMLPGTGYPLGFWFAQQGSIIAFVCLILAYALIMNRMDQRHIAALKNALGQDVEEVSR